MKANRYFTVAALLVVCAGSAMAQKGGTNLAARIFKPKLQLSSKPQRIRPIAIAGTINGQVVTPYYPIVEDNDWPNGPWSTVYDCIEISPADPNTIPPALEGQPYENPAYGPAYMVPPNYGLKAAAPGARWTFPDTYENTFVTNDLEISPLYAGFDVDRVAHLWIWNPVTPGEHMFINISLTETFANTAAGLPPPPMGGPNNVSWGGFLDGVSLDYGTTNGPGFYFDSVDLSAGLTPIQLSLPVDGKGAYIMQLLSNTTPPTLASRGQFAIWMCKQTNAALPGGNHSNQLINQWDDDVDVTSPAPPGTPINNSDGRHFTNPPGPAHLVELYEYPHSMLPVPLPPGTPENLGATMGLYSQFGAFTAAANSDVTVVQGFPFGAITAAALRVAGSSAVSVLCDEANPVGEVQVRVPTPATTTSAMSFIVRSRATRTDLSEFIQVWDNPANNWANLNFRATTINYVDTRIDRTANAANYLAPNGDVRMSVFWVPTQELVAFDGWTQSIDRLTVFVKGVQSN